LPALIASVTLRRLANPASVKALSKVVSVIFICYPFVNVSIKVIEIKDQLPCNFSFRLKIIQP
jgi:hypothetical protein